MRNGYSLSLAPDAMKIAVDPNYSEADMHYEVGNATFYRMTSDAFFANCDVGQLMPDGFDLAYIDGMHLFEFALRDFINLERYSNRGSVIIVDDVLPRSESEASRTPTGGSWTGDVWKIIPTLVEYRKDLSDLMILARSAPTGCLIMLNPDANNDVLRKQYDEIVAKYVNNEMTVPSEEILKQALSAEVALERLALARIVRS